MRTDIDKEEKFVTIDYETWETKYKPFDELVSSLNYQIKRLEDELNTKEITLFVRTDRYYHHYAKLVGYVNIDATGGHSINGFNKDKLLEVIQDELKVPLPNVKETKELLEKLYEAHRKAMALPRLVRWILGIKN